MGLSLPNFFLEMDTCYWDGSCENGGTCRNLDGPTNYTCDCVPGYVGDQCETGLCEIIDTITAVYNECENLKPYHVFCSISRF